MSTTSENPLTTARYTRLRRFRDDSRATAMLEMTILTPVLLMIGLGVIEFGNLLFKRHMIENGIRDAARYMAGQPDCMGSRTIAANIATRGTIDTSGTPRVANWSLDPINDIDCEARTDTYDTVKLRGGIGGFLTVVRINTTVNYGALELGFLSVLDRIGPTGFTTTSFPVTHEERWYGNR